MTFTSRDILLNCHFRVISRASILIALHSCTLTNVRKARIRPKKLNVAQFFRVFEFYSEDLLFSKLGLFNYHVKKM